MVWTFVYILIGLVCLDVSGTSYHNRAVAHRTMLGRLRRITTYLFMKRGKMISCICNKIRSETVHSNHAESKFKRLSPMSASRSAGM